MNDGFQQTVELLISDIDWSPHAWSWLCLFAHFPIEYWLWAGFWGNVSSSSPNQEGMDSNGSLAAVHVYIAEILALVTTTEAYRVTASHWLWLLRAWKMGVWELSSTGLTLSEATANFSISFRDGVMPSAMEKRHLWNHEEVVLNSHMREKQLLGSKQCVHWVGIPKVIALKPLCDDTSPWIRQTETLYMCRLCL